MVINTTSQDPPPAPFPSILSTRCSRYGGTSGVQCQSSFDDDDLANRCAQMILIKCCGEYFRDVSPKYLHRQRLSDLRSSLVMTYTEDMRSGCHSRHCIYSEKTDGDNGDELSRQLKLSSFAYRRQVFKIRRGASLVYLREAANTSNRGVDGH